MEKQDQYNEQIEALYANMNDDERLSQLHGIYLDALFNETCLDEKACAKLIPNGIGHVSQFAVTRRNTPTELRDMVRQLQDWLKKNTPNGIPALFHDEVLSGIATYGATIYPQQIGLACSFNTELAQKKTQQTADDFRKMGGRLALSPMVDVVRNPSFNRLEESYGEDGFLSAAMGVAFVRGLQNDDVKHNIAACTKHFLGYGGGGDAPEKELMEDVLFPHEAIVRMCGSKVVMTGYHKFNGINCVANNQLQNEILRDYLHFDGLTVSDYGSIGQLPEADDAIKAASALNAGNDVDFPEGKSYKHLPEAIRLGLTTASKFEQAVKRVLKLKYELGMLDENAELYAEGNIVFDTPEKRKTAYELATQSIVLLENNGILPLKKPLKMFLTGPNANSMWAMLGDYTYPSMRFFWQLQTEDGQHPYIIRLKDGLENRLPERFTLKYSRGCDWTEEVETVIEETGDERASYMRKIQKRTIDSGETANRGEALKMAAESDVIVAAMGENAILCGENRDRTSLRLPGRQEDFVKELLATGKPVILVLFGGRAQVITSVAKQCAAVIQAWYPGEEGGNAVADILFGKVSPSAKLCVTYPAKELHEAICYNYGLKKDDPRVLYPFGYGLSYTTFLYDELAIDVEADISGSPFEVSFCITNTGTIVAEEIAQVYFAPKTPDSKLKPIQLQGFNRVRLNPGEKRRLFFRFSTEQLGYFENGMWQVDPGTYKILVGASAIDIRLTAEFTLQGKQKKVALRTADVAENGYFPQRWIE
ncbi:MAG: glycoside hydrolase family 3 C-terminal domain-containing protein [Paludibacteraceae bacterium]|nr:glycoside hydrolase family 3 C-terminal domain-containing protein [Paludibacteraceae bacterium]